MLRSGIFVMIKLCGDDGWPADYVLPINYSSCPADFFLLRHGSRNPALIFVKQKKTP